MRKARNCKLVEKCTCDRDVSFSDKMVKLVILSGISDEEIKKEVLGTENLDEKTLNETVALIETKEIAARSLLTSLYIGVLVNTPLHSL